MAITCCYAKAFAEPVSHRHAFASSSRTPGVDVNIAPVCLPCFIEFCCSGTQHGETLKFVGQGLLPVGGLAEGASRGDLYVSIIVALPTAGLVASSASWPPRLNAACIAICQELRLIEHSTKQALRS
jgi:hypothetical protein